MFIFLAGLICSACIFSALAALVLWLSPRLEIRWWTLLIFVLFEYAGALGWSLLCRRLFAEPDGELRGALRIWIYITGVPFFAIFCGWLATFSVAFIFRRHTPDDIPPTP
jgi:hypothetical protein